MCNWGYAVGVIPGLLVGNEQKKQKIKSLEAQQASAPPKTIAAPRFADVNVMQAGDAERMRAAVLANANIKTSSLGLGTPATTTKKKLLGE